MQEDNVASSKGKAEPPYIPASSSDSEDDGIGPVECDAKNGMRRPVDKGTPPATSQAAQSRLGSSKLSSNHYTDYGL